MPATLTHTDRKLLDIAGTFYLYRGAEEQSIIDATGMSRTRAYQRINALIDTEAALAYSPLTVKRLRRRRDERVSRRRAV